MKALNKILISAGLVSSLFLLGSCVNDLDLLPNDPQTVTPGTFGENPEGYMDQVMADVYLQFAVHGANNNSSVSGFDGGMATWQRSIYILNEISTDESSWLPTADVDYGTFQYGIVPSNNRAILGTYSRFMINVTCCNQFIQTVKENYFQIDEFAGYDEAKKKLVNDKAKEYIRECKILRSAAYFYLLDCFGNPPYADENVPIGSVAPQLSTNFKEGRAAVYNKVVNTLKEVIAEYDADSSNPYAPQVYGYVGKEVAQALLVKFYLNAEVFTGTPAWNDCVAVAEQIIANHKGQGLDGNGLVEHYTNLFAANNEQYAKGKGGVEEIIWVIPQDANHLVSWANSTFMIDAYLGEVKGIECAKSDYNANDAWKCMTARTQFVKKFDWDDPEMSTSKDKRVALWKTSKHGFDVNNEILDQDHWGHNGYLPMKFTNFSYDDNGEPYPLRPEKEEDVVEGQIYSPAATTQTGGDYPMIRLAEIYLSAAEALVKGGGDAAKAVEYVNIIRKRAGLAEVATVTANFIEEERCRELYCEGTRRTDLVRYGKWISGYNWNWKNQVPGGADYLPHYVVWPLPSSIVSLAGYQQNPGY